jgi:hypothetical protein
MRRVCNGRMDTPVHCAQQCSSQYPPCLVHRAVTELLARQRLAKQKVFPPEKTARSFLFVYRADRSGWRSHWRRQTGALREGGGVVMYGGARRGRRPARCGGTEARASRHKPVFTVHE